MRGTGSPKSGSPVYNFNIFRSVSASNLQKIIWKFNHLHFFNSHLALQILKSKFFTFNLWFQWLPASIRETQDKIKMKNLIVHGIAFLISFSGCLLLSYKNTVGFRGGKKIYFSKAARLSECKRDVDNEAFQSQSVLVWVCSINPSQDIKHQVESSFTTCEKELVLGGEALLCEEGC